MQIQWVAAIDTCHRRGHLLFAHVLSLGLLVTCFCIMAWAQTLEVFEPPIVMHDDIEFQWGGQFPKPGSSLTPTETIISFQSPNNWRADPPQILRTPDGYGFNTPVMFIAHRVGLDFVFEEPFIYAEAQPLFYPQVAVTDDGVVVVGELGPDLQTHTYSRLIHIDWSGNEIYRYELFAPTEPGCNMVYDVRPVLPDDWSNFMLVASEWNEPGYTYRLKSQ